MDYRTLELNLAQLSRCLVKSKLNKYSDKRKEAYQKTLLELFEALKKEDYSKLNSSQLIEKKSLIDFVFESIQYLDNSTLTIIPFEIVYCLESVLNDWVPNKKFIVVTSLSNDLWDYRINTNLAFYEPIYTLIEKEYQKVFDYRLIQITLPRYYVHDYLSNVVLYHELGHFIDLHSNVSGTIVHNMVAQGLFKSDSETYDVVLNHYMEYFADIFAAQFIGETSNFFLNYIAYKALDSHSHPATDKRIEKVTKFLNGNTSDEIIEALKKYTLIRTGQNLEIRFRKLPLDDFYNLIPFEIKDNCDLHSIFLAGWETWQETPNELSTKFDNDTTYKIINNLIEKSISNYIVVNSWD